MGLFSASEQSTFTRTDITNVQTDITENIQDSFNRISSVTTDISDAFKNQTSTVISQPIAILANGSDGGGFNANQFFKDTSLDITGKSVGATGANNWLVFGLVVLVIGAIFLLRRKR